HRRRRRPQHPHRRGGGEECPRGRRTRDALIDKRLLDRARPGGNSHGVIEALRFDRYFFRTNAMDLDPSYLLFSLLFGAVGMGLFMYGKKAQRIPHLVAGLALMTCPYFITNLIAMSSVCIILAIVPWV